MYERFTDRARKTMALANAEALRFNHEYIGTEHILLGLIKEGAGVGANVLKNLDIDIRKVRLEVEKLVKSGPEMVALGKLPQTPRARKVIEYAIEEARTLNHNYVGTEHLLLGLMREYDGVAAQVLINLGLKLEEVREEVLNLRGAGVDTKVVDSIPREEPTGPAPTEGEILSWIRELIQTFADKEDSIRNADYAKAAALRDQEAALRAKVDSAPQFVWTVEIPSDAVESAPEEPQEGEWVAEEPAKSNVGHVLARIDIADASIRDLLSIVALDGEISIIDYLARTICDLDTLRAFYERQQSPIPHADVT